MLAPCGDRHPAVVYPSYWLATAGRSAKAVSQSCDRDDDRDHDRQKEQDPDQRRNPFCPFRA
jgi:hypothetical protein